MPTVRVNVLRDGERIDDAILSRMLRLEIRESDEEPSIAALRFGLTQRPGGAFGVLDEESFGPGDALGVEFAPPGSLPQRVFEGFVTHVRPHFESIESNCYVEVLAMDAAVLLDAQERAASYDDASDSEAASQIFERYGLGAEVDDTPARFIEDHQLLVQRATDWQFVRRLSRRNGFCCYFEFDPDSSNVVGHFHRRRLDGQSQADLTILREGANLNWVDFQTVFVGPVRHRGLAIDPLFKRLVRGDQDGELAPLGESGLPETIENGFKDAGAEAMTALLRDPFPNDAAIGAEASGRTGLAGFVIEGRGEIDPALYRGLLRARRPVLIKGVGERLSGVYYVRAVRTTWEADKLAQTFIAVRNAFGQRGDEDFGQKAEEVPAR